VYNRTATKLEIADLRQYIPACEFNYILSQIPMHRTVSGKELALLASLDLHLNDILRHEWENQRLYGFTILFNPVSGSMMILVRNPDWPIHWILEIGQGLDLYFAPIVIAFGTAMNLISIAVHQRKAFRSTSVEFILQCLAVTDSLNLTFVYSVTASQSWTGEYFLINCDSVYPEITLSKGRPTENVSPCVLGLLTVLRIESYLPQVAAWSLVILTVERLWSVRSREDC
jgi:hypothetical protein